MSSAPRSSRFSSNSLPRFRSQPIQSCGIGIPLTSAMEQVESRHVVTGVPLVQGVDSRLGELQAARASSGSLPVGASAKSVSSAKLSPGSGFARY